MEDRIKHLFFESPARQWHFEEIVKKAKLSRERANYYLKQLIKEGYIKRVKPKGEMPYYIALYESEKFKNEKRIYGLALLQKSGLFAHICENKRIKSAILFGSFASGYWLDESDIDLFIYGKADNFEKSKYELILGRELQLFCYDDKDKMKRELAPGLPSNIAAGFKIKGNLEPFLVNV
ncbi:MAG: nucleotidyltransferase domain-containing protein [Candidatus Nanoarchaeia archaeon]|nr:nucleotidyltransferase domain-containing protein [Candidatus Nanoarchaeia archaeon]